MGHIAQYVCAVENHVYHYQFRENVSLENEIKSSKIEIVSYQWYQHNSNE